MFKWLKRISFFKQYREPVDTILKGLQNDKFEITTSVNVSVYSTTNTVELQQGECKITLTHTTHHTPYVANQFSSDTDDWLTVEEIQTIYGLAEALYNAPMRRKREEIKRAYEIAKTNEHNARIAEVTRQLGVSNV